MIGIFVGRSCFAGSHGHNNAVRHIILLAKLDLPICEEVVWRIAWDYQQGKMHNRCSISFYGGSLETTQASTGASFILE